MSHHRSCFHALHAYRTYVRKSSPHCTWHACPKTMLTKLSCWMYRMCNEGKIKTMHKGSRQFVSADFPSCYSRHFWDSLVNYNFNFSGYVRLRGTVVQWRVIDHWGITNSTRKKKKKKITKLVFFRLDT